jgi:hypothetical protein
VSSPGAGFLRVAYFPAGRARDTAPAVSRLSLALCAGSRDVGIDRDPGTTPVALQGRRSAGAERHAGRSGAVARSARHRRVTPREPCHELKHPGIDDLQSSCFAGLTAGGVECNSTIPGEGTIPWYVPYFLFPWCARSAGIRPPARRRAGVHPSTGKRLTGRLRNVRVQRPCGAQMASARESTP